MVYPRVGGATDTRTDTEIYQAGLSPRGRGNLDFVASPVDALRSIPAWAGQPLQYLPARSILRVYPRVGGATFG